MKRKLLAVLLCLSILIGLLPRLALPAHAETYSGTCGDNLTWTLDTGTGELSIQGSGRMADYSYDSRAPWDTMKASIKNTTIGGGVTSIGDYAFSECGSLMSVMIPNSVTRVGVDALWGCTALTSVTISDSVTIIGSYAFSNCTRLTSMTIPDGVTSIGSGAFAGCSSLTKITVGSRNNEFSSDSNGALFNKNKTKLIQFPGAFKGSYTIPDSVTSIGISAFSGCTSLTSMTIPNSVTSIGDDAFSDCTSLTNVTIPNSVTSIGDWAFYNCASLTGVTIPNSVTRIAYASFSKCTALKSVTLPDSVTSIGDDAFYKCTSLTSVTIPNSVTSIASSFSDCTSLKSVTIPDSVRSIGFWAFSNCTSLASITIMNPACAISQSSDTLGVPGTTTVYGYAGSTAQEYAEKFGYSFDLISNSTLPAVLTDGIVRLIFADMAYARIPASCKDDGDTVDEWLAKKTYLNVTGKAGYDKKEMEDDRLFNNSDWNRLKVYSMVGDWKIVDVVNGAGGYAANVFQKGDDIVIAYRGSEEGPGSMFTKDEDWRVDMRFAIFNELDSRQFQSALDTYYAWADKGNVTLTGHSLGGALVTYVSTLTGAKGYSFDGAAGHVIDLTYLMEVLNVDFHTKDGMNFTNYTDPPRLDRFGADLIQHTNADLLPGVCYQTNENAVKDYPELFWTHTIYSNTKPSADGTALEFMPAAESHSPKDNWYASVDYSYQGILAGGVSGLLATGFNPLNAIAGGLIGYSFGRLFKSGSVHLGTASNDRISVTGSIGNVLDATAAVTENVIYGGDGADVLIGAAGTDILIPGSSKGDYLAGGLGNDIYVLDPESPGPFYISDGWGEDRIQTKTSRVFDITVLGYNEATKSYGFRIGNSCTVYLSKTLFKNSFSVVNSHGVAYGVIDNHGGYTKLFKGGPLPTAEPESVGKEVSIEGLCTVRVYDPEGNLAATYSTGEPGLFTEEFGTVYISDAEGVPFLTGTIYEDWRVEAEGSGSVDVAIVGTDAENYVNRTSLAENVDLSLGEATVVPDQHLVLQEDAPVAVEDRAKTVSVTISETEKAVDVGAPIELTAAAVFADGTETDAIYWTSSDPSILSCEQDETGKWVILATEAGEAELYAAAEDSGYYAVCKVTASYRLPCSDGISCPGKRFEDMPKHGNWAHDPIDWAFLTGVTTGTTDTTFSPSKTCTRGQVVTFLWRACGCPEPTQTSHPFTDVKEGAFYYKAMLWAVENGITTGTTETTFSPGKDCTRGQVVTFLWRAAGQPEPESASCPFTDVKTSASYYKAVLWAVENGVTSGTSATAFSPSKTCTRGQVVTFLYRAVAEE